MDAPLTERILARLPGSRWVWIGLWLIVPLAAMNWTVQRDPSPTFPGWAFLMSFTYAFLAAIPGIRWLAHSTASLAPLVTSLTREGRNPFGGIYRIDGPLILTAGIVAAFPLVNYLQDPRLSTALAIGFVAVLTVPTATLVWVIGTIFVGLSRMGRTSLNLHPFESDRSLGLAPLGVLAFRTVLVFLLVSLPPAVTGTQMVRDAVFNLGAYVVIILLFFGSLVGLRRQLLAAKRRHLEWARNRYAQAFRTAREAAGGLREAAADLQVAESFERRAESIQEWPFDERIFRTLAAVFSSVVATIAARLILIQMGL